MTKRPIRVKQYGSHKLDRASRLNYAKIYTIEYHVKAWFVGEIRESIRVAFLLYLFYITAIHVTALCLDLFCF